MRIVSKWTVESTGWRYLRVEGYGPETFVYSGYTYRRCGRDSRKDQTVYRVRVPSRDDVEPACTALAIIRPTFEEFYRDNRP